MNHSRTTLVLMEQIIMVLVFALAAALCVQVFVYASVESRRNDQRDRAAEVAQSAAETLKQSGREPAQEIEQTFYDASWNAIADSTQYSYRLEVRSVAAAVEGLAKADLCVFRDAGEQADEMLFELTVAWQEVDANA